MLTVLVGKYNQRKDLINYFILTYLDKTISFALPLSILFVIKDKSLYTFVEVAFSYATIAMVLIELGISKYLFWGYKNAEDKEKFISDSQIFFSFLLVLYCLLSIPAIIYIHYCNKELLLLFSIICIRTLFTFFVTFFSTIFRLTDNPGKIYFITIPVSIFSFILLLSADYFSWNYKVLYFFLPSIVLVIGVSIKFLLFESTLFNLNDFLSFLKKALKFAWPIILNVLAMNFMNNYAKIYAYGNLSEQEMLEISYIMRIGLIVQLTHTSFSSFFSKSLFMDVNRKFNMKIFRQYNIILVGSAFLVVFIILCSNYLFGSFIKIPLNLSTFLFILYIILWCYIAYLELYFGVMNANKKILYYSIVSSIVFIALLKIVDDISLLQLSVFMIITVALNLTLVITGLNKLAVFSNPSQKISDE